MDILKKKKAEREAYLKLLGSTNNSAAEIPEHIESVSYSTSNDQIVHSQLKTESPVSYMSTIDHNANIITSNPVLPIGSPKPVANSITRGAGIRELLGDQSPEQATIKAAKKVELAKLLQDQMDDDKRRKDLRRKEDELLEKREEERIMKEDDAASRKREEDRMRIEADRIKKELQVIPTHVQPEPLLRRVKREIDFAAEAAIAPITVSEPQVERTVNSFPRYHEQEIQSTSAFQNNVIVDQMRFENDFLKREQISSRNMIEVLQQRMAQLEQENNLQRKEMSDLRQSLSNWQPNTEAASKPSTSSIKQSMAKAVALTKDHVPKFSRTSSIYDTTAFDVEIDIPLSKFDCDDDNDSDDGLAKTLQGESEFLYPDAKPFPTNKRK